MNRTYLFTVLEHVIEYVTHSLRSDFDYFISYPSQENVSFDIYSAKKPPNVLVGNYCMSHSVGEEPAPSVKSHPQSTLFLVS